MAFGAVEAERPAIRKVREALYFGKFSRINKASVCGTRADTFIVRIEHMEKQEPKSKWDELAREIGAEVSPETEQREEEVAQRPSKTEGIARESEPSHSPSPKKAAVDWNALAGELGLPPAPAEEAPAEPKSEERPKVRETVRREAPREREPEAEAPPRRERARREEREPRREERPPRAPRGEQRESRERGGSRRGQRGRGRDEGAESQERRPPRREPNRDREERAGERPRREEKPPREEERAQQPPEPPLPPHEEPAKPAAVSLWHKIFGAPTPEPTPTFIDQPEVPFSESPSDYRDEPRDAGGFADAHPDEPSGEAREDDDADDREAASKSGGDRESEDRSRGGRPRRRRGRGRGRRSESAAEEDQSREPRSAKGRSAPRTSESDQFADDDLDDDLDVEEPEIDLGDDADDDDSAPREGGSRGRGALARAIPTWDEAIGYIVDSNLQTRSERRPPPRSGSRDGGGRGRPRGRRRPQ
jgi:hypothetical protein